MSQSVFFWFFALGVALTSPCIVAGAEARVELELVTDQLAPITSAQSWVSALRDIGFDSIRIRSANAGDRVEIVEAGREGSRRYRVVGMLTAGSKLQLPGGKFAMGDKRSLRIWLEKIRQGGEQGLTATTTAFGLSPQELVDIHDRMAVPVARSTLQQRPRDVISSISRGLTLRIEIDPAERGVFNGSELVADELVGVSSGTSLAAVLRPLGLVLVPRKDRDDRLALWVTDVRRAEESWPIGWPPETPERELVPKLFTFVDVEVRDQALPVATGAIIERLELPLLWDHNSLARHRIDPAMVQVDLPDGRSYYKKILERLLYQAGLKHETRVDEAGQPLMWVSTIKR